MKKKLITMLLVVSTITSCFAGCGNKETAKSSEASKESVTQNASTETSTGMFRYGMLREGIRQLGDERFLFGTDYPIVNPGMYVQAVYQEHISEKSKENIFYKNTMRILG